MLSFNYAVLRKIGCMLTAVIYICQQEIKVREGAKPQSDNTFDNSILK